MESRHKFAHFPFGGGARVCIGQNFAILESQMILSAIVQNFEFELLPDQEIIPDPTFTLIPKNGIKMRLRRIKLG